MSKIIIVLVVMGLIYLEKHDIKLAKIEGCEITMRDLYTRAGIKTIDEDSLKEFCQNKVSGK